MVLINGDAGDVVGYDDGNGDVDDGKGAGNNAINHG